MNGRLSDENSAIHTVGYSQPRSKGFTLIELLIVTVIIGSLAMIAIPSFNGQATKSRRADARQSLYVAAQSLERCFTEKNSYSSSAGCVDYSGTGKLSKEGYYRITGVQSPTSYVLTANTVPSGPQANDSYCTMFSLSDVGLKTATHVDCW